MKRVNNIHKDNEIFARKIVKIPHKPYSLLLESKFFRAEDAGDAAGPSSSGSKSRTEDEASVLVDIVNNSTSSPLSPLSTQSPASPMEEPDETEVLIRTGSITPDISPLHCSGADGDMSWRFLLLVVIFIGIGGPAIYIWYFWGHLEKEKS